MKFLKPNQLTLILLLALCSLNVYSQSSSSYMRSKKTGIIYVPRINPAQLVMTNDSTNLQFTSISENTERYRKTGKVKSSKVRKFEYDKNGLLTRFTYYWNDKLESYVTYHYNDSGYLVETREYNKKNQIEDRVTQVFKNGRVIEYQSYDDSLKPKLRITYEYNNSGKITVFKRYRKGKLKYHYENEYYENGDMKRSTSYNKRGKVIYVSNYECDPRGKIEEKKKDTATVCISKTALENGGRMEIHLRTLPNLDQSKTIYFYDPEDRMIKREWYYTGSDQMWESKEWGYAKDGSYTMLLDTFYRKNGTPSYSWNESLINGDIHKSYTNYNRKGEIKSKSKYVFEKDDEGKIIVKTVLDEDNRKLSVVRYMYN